MTSFRFDPESVAGSFTAAAGSVTGRDHRRAHRDGQDGFALVATPKVTAAIVTDGCSSGPTSEVGARLGATWIAQRITRVFSSAAAHLDPVGGARAVTSGLVDHLDATARSLSGSSPP